MTEDDVLNAFGDRATLATSAQRREAVIWILHKAGSQGRSANSVGWALVRRGLLTKPAHPGNCVLPATAILRAMKRDNLVLKLAGKDRWDSGSWHLTPAGQALVPQDDPLPAAGEHGEEGMIQVRFDLDGYMAWLLRGLENFRKDVLAVLPDRNLGAGI